MMARGALRFAHNNQDFASVLLRWRQAVEQMRIDAMQAPSLPPRCHTLLRPQRLARSL